MTDTNDEPELFVIAKNDVVSEYPSSCYPVVNDENWVEIRNAEHLSVAFFHAPIKVYRRGY